MTPAKIGHQSHIHNMCLLRRTIIKMLLHWLLVVVLVAFVFFIYREMYGKTRKYPPGPRPWPLIGNILQLDPSNPEITIFNWGKKYGPMFTIWMPRPYVIINDFNLMKETFLKKGDIFAGRPMTFLQDTIAKGNFGLVFSTGALWRKERRFALHILRDFGVGRNIMEPKILHEAKQLVKRLTALNGQPVDLKQQLTFAVGNVITALTFGRTWEYGDEKYVKFMAISDELLPYFVKPQIMLMEEMPWLRYLESVFGLQLGLKRMISVNGKFIRFFQDEIDIHKDRLDCTMDPDNYIDAVLMELKRREQSGQKGEMDEWQLLVALGDLFTAGSETTVTTMRFAIQYLLKYPEVQQKLHTEIDTVIGKDRDVTMNDQKSLPYLCATLQEVQRLANLLPINLQHTVTQDVQINEFLIEKDTIVIPQIASLHRDPETFPLPDRFEPERHLDREGRFVKNERVVPFSLGKRSCLGENLARMELFLFLATLLQHLHFQAAPNEQPNLDIHFHLIRAPVPFKCSVLARDI